jgi:hypothetical protein
MSVRAADCSAGVAAIEVRAAVCSSIAMTVWNSLGTKPLKGIQASKTMVVLFPHPEK